MLSARSIFHENHDEIAASLGGSPLKRGVLRLGARVVYLVERSWT
jgi:hypothetical protein